MISRDSECERWVAIAVSVGFAMDALHRLSRHGYPAAVEACRVALDPASALVPSESLCRTLDGAGPIPTLSFTS